MSAEEKAAAAKPAPARPRRSGATATGAKTAQAKPAEAKTSSARPKSGAKRASARATDDASRGAKPRDAKARTPQWDISDLEQWGPERHELGATIPEAGNSVYNETGGWRTYVPEIDSAKCDGCMLCYFYCPDASIKVEGGKAVGVDLEHCKGCGICAKECPRHAITMKIDEKE